MNGRERFRTQGSSAINRNRTLWRNDPVMRSVQNGAFKTEFLTQVITAMTHQGQLGVFVIVFDDQKREVCHLGTALTNALDPLVAYRAHRLVSQVPLFDVNDPKLFAAAVTVAALANGLLDVDTGVDPKEAEVLLRKSIGDVAYNAAIVDIPIDIGHTLSLLKEWGVTVYTESIAIAVEAGQVAYEAVAKFGVESPENRAARKAKREEVLLPLRPIFEKYLEGPADNRAGRLKVLEDNAVELASYGFQDTDILVGWALYQELQSRGVADNILAETLLSTIVGMKPKGRTCYADRAANLVTQLLDEDPNCRDQVSLRRELAGIEHDLHFGLLEVEQNELSEVLS